MRSLSGALAGLSVLSLGSCVRGPSAELPSQIAPSEKLGHPLVVIEVKNGRPTSAHDLLRMKEQDVSALLGEPAAKRNEKDRESGARQTRYVYYVPVSKKALMTGILTLLIQKNRVVDVRYSESLCVAEGTLVDTAQGKRPVETLQVGDKVLGYDLEKDAPAVATVTSISSGVAHETFIIRGALRVTSGHPVYAGGAYRPAAAISPRDSLLTRDGTAVMAGEIHCKREAVVVYDLSVSGPHNGWGSRA
jgi:hypothetical protein